MPTAEAVYNAFIHALDSSKEATDVWSKAWNTTEWTEIATILLSNAVLSALPDRGVERQTAGKGTPDKYNRKEYLNIDLFGYEDDWGPPLVIAELENTPRKPRYCAWKLLCIDSSVRILIAYIDPTSTYDKYHSTVEELLEDIRQVSAAHPGKPLHLFCGRWMTSPKTDDGWKKVFSIHTV